MAISDYSIDTSGTPQDVQRRQKLAEALMKQGSDTSPAAGGPGGGWITALNRGLAGALAGYQSGQARAEEQQGRSSYQQQLAQALGSGGNITPQAMITLAGNPWANPAQTQAISHVADMQRQSARDAIADKHWAASYALQKQAAARADQAAERANMTPLDQMEERGPAAEALGLEPGSPEYSSYVANGKYSPEVTAPSGYEMNPNFGKVDGASRLRPISGGPQDPSTVSALAKAKNTYEPMNDETADFLAERVLAGDTKALIGLGRGAQGAENLAKIQGLVAQKAKSGVPVSEAAQGILNNAAQQAALVSASRALGTKETHFGVAEKAMEESLPLAQKASDAVPRTEWLHLNKLIQLGQTEHTNPTLKRFLIATDTAAKDYARTINPTGQLREGDIAYARKILSTADGPEAYRAALDQLHQEAQVMHRAIQRQKDELKGGHAEAQKSSGPVKIDGYTIKEN